MDVTYALGLEPQEALKYFQHKGLKTRFKWTDLWEEAHAKAFTVAGVMKADVLSDIRAELAKALKQGGTLADFEKNITPMLERKGYFTRQGRTRMVDQATGEITGKKLTPLRLKTIYQTNMQSAYMAGRFADMMQNVADRPNWQYVAVLDARTRPAHRALNGRVFRYDDKFWGSFYPPNGFNCRCRVRPLSDGNLQSRGLSLSRSEGHLSQVTVPIGKNLGAVVGKFKDASMPDAVLTDPGFNFNPGRAVWQPNLNQRPNDLARNLVQRNLHGPAFERFVAGKDEGTFAVAVLRPEDQAAFGAKTQSVLLSSEMLAKQKAQHPEIGLEDYRQLPKLMDEGEVYQRMDQRLVYFYAGDVLYRAVLKVMGNAEENYLLSLFKTSAKVAEDNKAYLKRVR